jgi:hypothetical protein
MMRIAASGLMIARAATRVLVLVAIFLVPVAGRFGCSVGLAGGLLQFNELARGAFIGNCRAKSRIVLAVVTLLDQLARP